MNIAGIPIKVLVEKIPAIVQAAITEKNRERFAELLENAGEMKAETMDFIEQINRDSGNCAKLIIEMLRGPLAAAGFDIEIDGSSARDLDFAEMEVFLISELKKLRE